MALVLVKAFPVTSSTPPLTHPSGFSHTNHKWDFGNEVRLCPFNLYHTTPAVQLYFNVISFSLLILLNFFHFFLTVFYCSPYIYVKYFFTIGIYIMYNLRAVQKHIAFNKLQGLSTYN